MKHLSFRTIVSTAILATGMFAAGPAQAHNHTKKIQLHLHNDTNDTPMTCTVSKVYVAPDGAETATVLRSFSVTPKNDRAASVRNRPQQFEMTVRYIGRRYDRTPVFPKLRLTCELETRNTENHSPLWDDNEQSFSSNRFKGSCTLGRFCSVRVERR